MSERENEVTITLLQCAVIRQRFICESKDTRHALWLRENYDHLFSFELWIKQSSDHVSRWARRGEITAQSVDAIATNLRMERVLDRIAWRGLCLRWIRRHAITASLLCFEVWTFFRRWNGMRFHSKYWRRPRWFICIWQINNSSAWAVMNGQCAVLIRNGAWETISQ